MRPRVVLFGDSITEFSFADGGWGASLAHHFGRQVDVVLRGLSGYNTRWALKVVGKVMEGVADDGVDPAAITVFFGANDAALPDRKQAFQNVPIDEYQTNLLLLCTFFKERWPSTSVILITPPPIDEEARIKDMFGDDPTGLPERTNEAAGAYAKACIAVAKEAGLQVIDIWSKMQEVPDWKKACLCDGLHFTALGNKVLFEEVLQTLKDLGLNKETLPPDAPIFWDIDPKDPMKAFEN